MADVHATTWNETTAGSRTESVLGGRANRGKCNISLEALQVVVKLGPVLALTVSHRPDADCFAAARATWFLPLVPYILSTPAELISSISKADDV